MNSEEEKYMNLEKEGFDMRSKWLSRVLLSAIVLCSTYASGTFAQQPEQTNEMSEDESEDLKWQLKQMEESVQRQQEQIQALKNIVGEISAENKGVGTALNQYNRYDAPQAGADLGNIVQYFKGFKLGVLWYISYQNGDRGTINGGESYNTFAAKRGYLTVEKEFFSWFTGRITSDITTVRDQTSNLDGSLTLRIKYLYGKFIAPDMAFLTKPSVEVGVVHVPWQDFEENVNYYRAQDTMFLERNGIANSADLGATFSTLLGGCMDEKYMQEVNPAWPGRYGSIEAGVYNGGGFAASEQNSNKVLEERITIRPLPDFIPGLQFTYFGVQGKGNAVQEPDWRVNDLFASFEHKYFVLTGQYYWGTGNQQGTDENNKRGYSFFTELKPHKKFSVIGRFDHFNPNTDVSNEENNRYIAGIAYHIDKLHKNMVILDYDTVKYEQAERSDDKRVQLTLQIAF